MSAEFEEAARAVLDVFAAKGLMVATVESCTGGLLAAALTDIPGSSAVVERGFVTYSNAAKAEMAEVDPALILTHGAVSPEVAGAMAAGGLAHSGADVAVAITGVAGPGGSDHKPEGRVCFHACARDGRAEARLREFGPQGRAEVRRLSVLEALDMLRAMGAEA